MSNPANKPQIGFSSKVGINVALTKTLFAALTRLVTSPFKGSNGAPTYFRDVVYAATRTQLRNLSNEQAQYMNPTTLEVYLAFTKERKLEPQIVDIGNNAQALWLGAKDAKTMLVYFHGGGYVLPLTPAHMNYLSGLISDLSKTGATISLCLLSYTLSPQAQYPTQLSQAATLLNYLVRTECRSPSSLVLAGDSAGGNILAGLVSHLVHPHPSVPAVTLDGPLGAALLISPWVSFDSSHPSYSRNAQSDMFDRVPLDKWSRAFLGSKARQGILLGDSYSEPLIAEPSWWSGAHEKVSEVLIWGGGGEIFIDGIKAFGEKFAEGWIAGGGEAGKVRTVVQDRMCHEEPIVDIILGYKTKGKGAQNVEDFVRSKL